LNKKTRTNGILVIPGIKFPTRYGFIHMKEFRLPYAIALHFVYYNFCKIHLSLSITPAMQAGLTKGVMSVEDIANLAAIEAPKKRGSYRKAE